jgi:hypothetical protein
MRPSWLLVEYTSEPRSDDVIEQNFALNVTPKTTYRYTTSCNVQRPGCRKLINTFVSLVAAGNAYKPGPSGWQLRYLG